jgi:hypothetical protein
MRVPWPPLFPDVVIHTDVATRDGHHGYVAAKSGDADAVLELVIDLVSDAAVLAIQHELGGRDALLLPVTADETLGFNVQTNKVGHTRAKTFQRLVTHPTFAGPVELNANYFLVDDHVGLGGTLANLRGHIEEHGGRVIGMTTLTESHGARTISLRPETLDVLWNKHGEELQQLWQS